MDTRFTPIERTTVHSDAGAKPLGCLLMLLSAAITVGSITWLLRWLFP